MKHTIRFRWSLLFGRYYKATKCGHKTKLWGKIKGGIGLLSLIGGQVEYCHQCISDMAIRCAWCGEFILIGDPITLYTPKKDYKIPEYAVVYKDDPFLQLVGCLRWNCSQPGGDRAGFWVPPGRVHRVLSPIEQSILSEGVIIVEDLSDAKEAVSYS